MMRPLNVTSRHEIQPRENPHPASLPPLPSRFSPSLPFPSSSLIFPPSTGQRSLPPSSSLIRLPLISPLPPPTCQDFPSTPASLAIPWHFTSSHFKLNFNDIHHILFVLVTCKKLLMNLVLLMKLVQFVSLLQQSPLLQCPPL